MITIDQVTVAFGTRPVLESISTSIDPGGFVGLVGPNGAGKTTLLRAISGVKEPDSGSVFVDGIDVSACSSRESSRLVSVVPQDTSLSFSFSVRHLVEMGRTPYRSRFSPPTVEDRQLVDQALERTQTKHLATRNVDELSGGERQRVVLARALAQDTPVILLDEPTANLDVNHQVEVLGLAQSLVDSGKTVVAAIHDLDLAARFCDELIVLAGGDILERGPPSDVLDTEVLERAYGTAGSISINPVTWTPAVTAISNDDREVNVPGRIHVVGTGDAAARMVSTIHGAGSTCTIGPVPRGDAAAVTAEHLGIDTISVDPFSSITERTRSRLESITGDADVTVLVPGGPLDEHPEVWNSIRTPHTVYVDTNDEGDRSPALDRLRARSIETTPKSIRAGLSTAVSDHPTPRGPLVQDD
nr:ATP-binding cassette domain-containing protein [Halovivax gelatinilyticus]